MKRILHRIETKGHLHLKARPNAGTVSVWVAVTYDNYIVGLKKNLTKTLAVIPTTYNNCIDPTQIMVDHSQNVWAGCQLGEDEYDAGSVSEWNSAGNPVASYSVRCPSNWGGCSGIFYATGTFAGAADANHVFAAMGSVSGYACPSPSSCVFESGTGIEWWPAGQPSATPIIDFIPAGNSDYQLINHIDYMDEDSSGNLWFTFSSNVFPGTGIGEIANPASPSWTLTEIEPPRYYQCPGGVNVSNGGAILNVTDPCTRVTRQYAMPVQFDQTPSNTLGPTPLNAFGQGSPISGGFNANESKLILSDGAGWLDRGIVSTNKWTSKGNGDMQDPQGAAFTPSDK
jgi:hypothetical protein